MRWSEITALPTDRKLREFAAIAAALCAAVAVMYGAQGRGYGLAAIYGGIAMTIGVLGVVRPQWLAPIFIGWMILAFPVAWIVSTLLLAAVFYGLVTPLALVFRLMGRDALDRKLRQDQDSYWQARPAAENPRRYLRQY